MLSIPGTVLTPKSKMVSCDAESSNGIDIPNGFCRYREVEIGEIVEVRLGSKLLYQEGLVCIRYCLIF